jgi:Uma2 family endonuclease
MAVDDAKAVIESLTATEFEAMYLADDRADLVLGEVVREPVAGYQHGVVASTVGHYLWSFVRRHRLGQVCGAETGFVLSRNPDTVRGPDAALVAASRLVGHGPVTGFFDGAPDLAVEVISPGNPRREV